METQDQVTRSALEFFCGLNNKLCRLCLTATVESDAYLHQTVNLKTPYTDEVIPYGDILLELGFQEDLLLPEVLCQSCSKTIIQSYLMQKLKMYSRNKWNEAINKLNTILSETVAISPSTQTMYVVVRGNKNLIYTSRKRSKKLNKATALTKMKSIMKSRLYYKTNKVKFEASYDDNDEIQQESLMCGQCGHISDSQKSFAAHMRSHEDKLCPCKICGKLFTTEKQVAQHKERIHKEKTIMCSKCSKKFSTKRTLALHNQMHHIAVNCKLCFIQFPSRYALKFHLDKHDINKCSKCNKEFRNKVTYRFHLKICGKKEEPSFFCDICSKGYVRKNGLRSHLKVDHGFGNVISCNWCNKKFDAISKLKNHIVKHTKEKNFSCDLCSGVFVTSAALTYHKRLHTGEKPFPCDMCDESFLSASRRMEHKYRKHCTPSKECSLCHAKFVMARQLKKHYLRHYNPQSKLYLPKAAENADPEFLIPE